MTTLLVKNLSLAYKGSKFYVVSLMTASIVHAALELGSIFIISLIIDTLVKYIQDPNPNFSNKIWILFAITIIRWALDNMTLQFMDYLNEVYRPKIVNYLDNTIIDKFNKLPTHIIEDSNLQDRVSNIHTFSKQKFVDNIDLGGIFIQSLSKFIFAFVVLFFSNYLVALLIILISIPEVKYNLNIIKKLRQSNEKLTLERRRGNYYVNITQDISNYFNLKSYNLFPYLLDKIKGIQNNIKDNTNSIQKFHRPRQILIGTIANLFGQFIPKAYYLWLTIQGKISIGQFQLYFRYIDELYNNTFYLYNSYLQITENNIYVEDLFKFLELQEDNLSGNSKIDLSYIELEFKNVSFAYPGSTKEVLKNINLHINPGEKIAIVGANGSGKTTITKLLNKFYGPTSGEILVNGINLNLIDTTYFRSFVSNLTQEVPRYFMTLKENILIGDVTKKYNEDKFNNSAKQAFLVNDINKLVHKKNTMLGKYFPDGINLSGGQWQKLSIARSFYRTAPLLILDEPTSAIDSETEQKIFTNIFDNSSSQTQIIISHKFSNIKNANCIFVLKEGEIIENGTHDSLMNLNGEYARLYTLQAKSFY